MPFIKLYNGEEVEYVEVHEEPNHKHQFDNEYVWSYIAGFEPGETCKWHRHSEDSFYVALTHGQALNRPSDKEEFVHVMHQGDKWWSLYKNKPFVHQVCLLKECNCPAAFFAVEILKSPPIGSDSPLPELSNIYTLNKEYSNAKARIYDVSIDPQQSTGVHTWPFYGTVLSLSNGELESSGENSPFAEGALSSYGSYKWVQGPVEFSVTNKGTAPYKAVIIEWLQQKEE